MPPRNPFATATDHYAAFKRGASVYPPQNKDKFANTGIQYEAAQLPTYKHIPLRPPVGVLPFYHVPGETLCLPPRTGHDSLSDADYELAAKKLDCEALVIRAIAKQEGKDKGFDDHGRPTILYEPTHFLSYTGPKNDADHFVPYEIYRARYPEVTQYLPPPSTPYGSPDMQWQHLQKAYLMNANAALQSVSWGKFQTLGSNFHLAGFASVEMLVSAVCSSEQKQLDAFVNFVSSLGLESAMNKKDWKAIAAGYNGKKYYVKHYDKKLEHIYETLRSKSGT